MALQLPLLLRFAALHHCLLLSQVLFLLQVRCNDQLMFLARNRRLTGGSTYVCERLLHNTKISAGYRDEFIFSLSADKDLSGLFHNSITFGPLESMSIALSLPYRPRATQNSAVLNRRLRSKMSEW